MAPKKERELFEQYYQAMHHDGKVMSMALLLQRAAQKFGNTTALIFNDTVISYTELFKRACAFAYTVQQAGVNKHDRVLLMFENSPEFYVAYFGSVQTGAVVVPVNTFLKERELTHIVNDAEPALIIAHTKFAGVLQKTHTQVPILTEIEINQVNSSVDIVTEPAPDDMIALLYTSGTTGLPKGVMLSSKNIMSNVAQGLSRFSFEQRQEKFFAVLPLFHSFAQNTFVWTALYMGATVVLVPKVERRAILKGLTHKPTVFFGVPALYGLLCLMKNAPIESIDCFVSGGDALPDKIRKHFSLLYRRKICSGYGLTETAPFISVHLDDVTTFTNNIGRPLAGITCVVKDERGNDLLQGAIGELCFKGDNIMLGYYNDQVQTGAVIKNNWLHSGDLGYLDEKGNIIITGRVKDLIIHKGFNIYPQEIENVLLTHANVLRVGVIGKQDNVVGQVPIAFVQLVKEQDACEVELLQLCKQHLAAYKVPKTIVCSTQELPVTATGKVDKKILRKKLVDNSYE